MGKVVRKDNQQFDSHSKLCRLCNTWRPLNAFHKDARCSSGRTSWCQDCDRARRNTAHRREKEQATSRLKRAQLKAEVFAAYGAICVCCGEAQLAFLAIDHITGGGNKHRKTIGVPSGNPFYRWLRDNKFPAGFRVLCHNCNNAARNACGCPHQLIIGERADAEV